MDKEILKQFFLAGFKVSGEGFNAEYPFADNGATDNDMFTIIKSEFEKEIEKLEGLNNE